MLLIDWFIPNMINVFRIGALKICMNNILMYLLDDSVTPNCCFGHSLMGFKLVIIAVILIIIRLHLCLYHRGVYEREMDLSNGAVRCKRARKRRLPHLLHQRMEEGTGLFCRINVLNLNRVNNFVDIVCVTVTH